MQRNEPNATNPEKNRKRNWMGRRMFSAAHPLKKQDNLKRPSAILIPRGYKPAH
jgi:hypothetical protein